MPILRANLIAAINAWDVDLARCQVPIVRVALVGLTLLLAHYLHNLIPWEHQTWLLPFYVPIIDIDLYIILQKSLLSFVSTEKLFKHIHVFRYLQDYVTRYLNHNSLFSRLKNPALQTKKILRKIFSERDLAAGISRCSWYQYSFVQNFRYSIGW
jgi:hypothetical protein